MLYPVYAVLFAETGLTAGQISSLFALWAGTAIVLELPTGALADRVSRRALLAIGASLRATGFALWVVWPSYPAFAAGFVLWAVSGALQSGTLEALVYDGLAETGHEEDYDRLIGRAAAVRGAFELLATAAAAPLLAVGGYRLLGLVSVLVCLVQVPVALAFPKAARAESAGGVREYAETLRAGVGEVVRSPKLRRLVLVAGLVPGLLAFDEYLSLFAHEIGVPGEWIPLYLLVPTVAGIAAAAYVGARQVRVAAIPLALGAVLVIAGALARSGAGLVAIGLSWGAFRVFSLVMDARVQHAVAGQARATVTSVVGTLAEVGAVLAFVLFGIGATWLPLHALLAIDAAVLLAIATYLKLTQRS